MIKLKHWMLAIVFAAGGLSFSSSRAQDAVPSQASSADAKAATEQASGLLQKVKAGEFMAMKDQGIIDFFGQLPPSAMAAFLSELTRPLSSYEMWIRRQERIKGKLNDEPYLNHMKYTHEPRRVYVKWLDGGPFSGQEMIYDETKRKNDAYGHLGGFFNVTALWLSLDGMLVRANTNHNIRDELSFQFFSQVLIQRLQAMQATGVRPVTVEVVNINGARRIAFTLPPAGQRSALYEGKIRFAIDLDQPMIRLFEAWDGSGELVERIVMDKLKPANLSDADFDPKNKEYKF